MTSPTFDYAKITGKVGVMVGDATDADENPDLVYATEGTVIFTPQVKNIRATSGTTPIIAPSVITATIDAQGRLSYNAQPEVYLLDLGSDLVNPKVDRGKGAYRVDFKGLKAGTVSFELDSFFINPSAADNDTGANDLGVLTPIPSGSGGQAIVRGPAGAGVPDTSTAAVGDVVQWDGTETVWAPESGGGGGATTLDGLTDVNAGSPADGQALTFDAATSEWVPATMTAEGTISSTDITDATEIGKDLLTAASQAAGRTAIGAGTSDFSGNYGDLVGLPSLGTAAGHNVEFFATAAQGAEADSAVQSSAVGAANGVASLDSGAHLPLSLLPAGSTLTVISAASWPARPTSRTDVYVRWVDQGALGTPPAGAIDGDSLLAAS